MRISGIGSWPGSDVPEAMRMVQDSVGDTPAEVSGIPYLPELPARGPGADLIGRSLGLLVDLPVDLQPQGWRLTAHPGRDARRTAALWREDLDTLAEVYDGWQGPLKVQVAGPWTLVAALWTPNGDRVLGDPGASRDVAASLAEGVKDHLATVGRLVPGAELVLQIDEPSLPAVLAGAIPTQSGLSRLRSVEGPVAQALLQELVQTARGAGAHETVIHCCAPEVPLALLAGAGRDGVALDLALLDRAGWEAAAEQVDAGLRLWAGVIPTDAAAAGAGSGTVKGGSAPTRSGLRGSSAAPRSAAALAERYGLGLRDRWRELGMDIASLRSLTLTPACGLGTLSPERARTITAAVTLAAKLLAEDD